MAFEWARIGSLAGLNYGSILNCSATVQLKGGQFSSGGGLVGWNYGLIKNSSAACTLSVPAGISWVSFGGIAGRNNGALIHCSSAGSITAEGWSTLGGMVGRNYGIIANSHSATTVSGDGWSTLGGLAGTHYDDLKGGSEWIIFNSSAAGVVAGKDMISIGGLVGRNMAVISYSHAAGPVTGKTYSNVGGLVGVNAYDDMSLDNKIGVILQSSASGSVTGEISSNAGGLAGINYGRISECYALGQVRSEFFTGGLAGRNERDDFDTTGAGGIISNCYSTGKVTGSGTIGGLAGSDSQAAIEFSYWDTVSSELLISAGGYGRTTEEMSYPHHENTYVHWDFQSIWQSDSNYSMNAGYPFLQGTPEYASEIVSSDLPLYLNDNNPLIMHLTFRNTGIKCWQAEESVLLGAVDNHDDLAPAQYWRIAQDRDIHHFQTYTYEVKLYPQQTGIFTTEWQMIKEGEFWFGEIFSQDVEVIERTGLNSHLWQLFQ